MRYYGLEKLINLFDGYRKQIKIDAHELLLIQDDNQRYLIESRCPHRRAELIHGSVHQGRIRCPMHGYEFDLHSGAVCAASEEACRHLQVYTLEDRDNEIGVLLQD